MHRPVAGPLFVVLLAVAPPGAVLAQRLERTPDHLTPEQVTTRHIC